MTIVKLVEGWKTNKRSLELLGLGLEQAQFLEDEGLLGYAEEELTRIARDLEGVVDFTLSNLHYDANSTDLSVGVDNRHIAEGLKKYHDNFGD